jgi:hypothetical protein
LCKVPVWISLSLWCASAGAQGVEPRKSPHEYPVHAAWEGGAVGAEYLVRSVSGRSRTFFLGEYLVVEVGLFPAPARQVQLSLSQFRLQVTEKKKQQTLAAIGPEFVAASLRYPDWQPRRRLEAIAGAGDGGVILGRPPAVERFPGDPTGRSRLPAPPRAPDTDHGIEAPEPVRAEDVVVETALREGITAAPVAGHLYFAWKGKTKDLRLVELICQSPSGSATLRLR